MRPYNSGMVGYLIPWPYPQLIDADGVVDEGAYYEVFLNKTTTDATLYTDRDIGTTATNPVVTADDAARFPMRYVATGALLTLVLRDSDGDEIASWDNWEPIPGIDSAALALYLPLAGVVPMTGPINEKEGAAIASATSVDFDAATGNFFHVSGTTTINTITLQSGYERTVVFDGILTLTQSANLLLGGTSFATHAGMVLVFRGEGSGVTRLVGGMTASGKSVSESVAYPIGIGDETTAIAAGLAKRTTRAPFALYITGARASLTTAQTSGDKVEIDVKIGGVSIFTTRITIDNNSTTSTTAAVPCVLTSTAILVADDAQITIDIVDVDGSTTAAGLKVSLIGYKFNLN